VLESEEIAWQIETVASLSGGLSLLFPLVMSVGISLVDRIMPTGTTGFIGIEE
jgi:hypothetical protein